MKDFIEDIDWFGVFVFLLFLFWIGFTAFMFIEAARNEPPQYSADTKRKLKVCQTYSTDFWRNDIDFIDGKCYYKGKEVEIK